MEYDSILKWVLQYANEEEKSRIKQEDELFQQREWQKYIAFICALLKESNKCFQQFYTRYGII